MSPQVAALLVGAVFTFTGILLEDAIRRRGRP